MKKHLTPEEANHLKKLCEDDKFVDLLLADFHVANLDKPNRPPKLFYQVVDEFQKRIVKTLRKKKLLSSMLDRILRIDDIACEIILSCNEANDEDVMAPFQNEHFREKFLPKIDKL